MMPQMLVTFTIAVFYCYEAVFYFHYYQLQWLYISYSENVSSLAILKKFAKVLRATSFRYLTKYFIDKDKHKYIFNLQQDQRLLNISSALKRISWHSFSFLFQILNFQVYLRL